MAARARSQVGVALDLMGRALEVGDVGARVATDTWLRWMNLAARLALVAAGQGVASWRGIETTGSVAEAFEAYVSQIADLPGQAGKRFELEWEAARNHKWQPDFRALLVPDVALWRGWVQLAEKFAQVSTAWQRSEGRVDRRYAPRLRRLAEMPLRASQDLDQEIQRLRAIMRPRRGELEAADVPVTMGHDVRASGKILRRLVMDEVDRVASLAGKLTPEREVATALKRYTGLLDDATAVAVASGQLYDRHVDRCCAARGVPVPWRRDQADVDDGLGELLDAQRERLVAQGSRISAQEMERLLEACEEKIEDLSRWPARSAQESNAAFDRMVRRERRRRR
jgi:hypothetical protein